MISIKAIYVKVNVWSVVAKMKKVQAEKEIRTTGEDVANLPLKKKSV